MKEAHFELHASVESRHWWFVGRRRILVSLIRQLASPGSGHALVDVGCGTGANVAAFAGAYRAVGIDPSPDAVALARQRFPDVRFFVGDAPRVAGEELAGAKAVLLTDVLEHVEDDRAFLAEIVAGMSAGSFLLVTVPAHPKLWSQHDVSFGHHRRYTRAVLRRLWHGLPVDVLLFSFFNSRLYPLARTVRAWNRLTGTAMGPKETDFVTPPRFMNDWLTRIFAGETKRLRRLLVGRGRPYSTGLSLIAVLRRTA